MNEVKFNEHTLRVEKLQLSQSRGVLTIIAHCDECLDKQVHQDACAFLAGMSGYDNVDVRLHMPEEATPAEADAPPFDMGDIPSPMDDDAPPFDISSETVTDVTLEREIETKPEVRLTEPPAPKQPAQPKPALRKKSNKKQGGTAIIGRLIDEKKFEEISDVNVENGSARVRGELVNYELIATRRKDRYVLKFVLTDHYGSVGVRAFLNEQQGNRCIKRFKKRCLIGVRGIVDYDKYSREYVIMADDICWYENPGRPDNAEDKRVELHAHTKMSGQDGIADAGELVMEAARMGHEAIAITDHGVVQAFPDAYGATFAAEKETGNSIKIIYGLEGYLADDTSYEGEDGPIDDIVVFDIETTGLDAMDDRITEIGAVRLIQGEVTDTFQTFVNPKIPLSDEIIKLTGITDQMLADAPEEQEALAAFAQFAGSSVLCAHNARFDVSFIRNAGERYGLPFSNGVIDTLVLARLLLPDNGRFGLAPLCKHFDIVNAQHHRASQDAEATAKVLLALLELHPAQRLHELNGIGSVKALPTYHVILLAKNKRGLNSMYSLVTDSHLKHFHKRPVIPKSVLQQRREDLIIGSACEAGEIFRAVLRKQDMQHQKLLADFYDYLEIQPLGNNAYLLREERGDGAWVSSEDDLRNLNLAILELAEQTGKPVAATCDSHFIHPYDEYYRRILMSGQGFKDADQQAPLYYRTTDEMLAEFEYLGSDKAYEVVVGVPSQISAQVEGGFGPYPDETFVPVEDGGDDLMRRIAHEGAIAIYGDPLPEIIQTRLDKEVNSIIKHGFATLYLAAYRLVKKSMELGYTVGSRGSVGSSLAALVMGISEVNPMAPHYVCPECKHSIFDTGESAGVGADLPARECPQCGAMMHKDGFDIPFEVFLGFEADKVPDIDLNFSDETRPAAFAEVERMFGKDNVFRAGTILGIKDKKAYGYVQKYLEERGLVVPRSERDRLIKGLTGIKQTTGQHPGGLVVLPQGMDIHDFTPLQHPADKSEGELITTHFDFNSLHDRLVKLDILGHDNPTFLRRLYDFSGIDPLGVPLDDEKMLSLFTSCEALGLTEEQLGTKTGVLGLPEFGTTFVRSMLEETKPTTVSELIRISGLSHGTDVWLNNAQELIQNGTATLNECICTRDDIMNYLIAQGVDARISFNTMESVRKGKGLTEQMESAMRDAKVPEWFIESCKRIKYMFPKAHAAAYVVSALRIGYFKVYYPREYYAAYFSVRGEEINAENVLGGAESIQKALRALQAKEERTARDEKEIAHLELALEMNLRGIGFIAPDLHRSEAKNFIIEGDNLLLPLSSVQGMGENAAKSVVEARADGPINTVDELKARTAVNNTVIDKLRILGALDEIPESAQIDMFSML